MKSEILNEIMAVSRYSFLIFLSKKTDKSDNTLKTLRILKNKNDITSSELTDILNIRPPSVTNIIKKLEEGGAIQKIRSNEDARVIFIKITKKGEDILETQDSISNDLLDLMFDKFSNEELEELNTLLSKINQNIKGDKFNKKVEEIFENDKRWQYYSKISSEMGRARREAFDKNSHSEFLKRRDKMNYMDRFKREDEN